MPNPRIVPRTYSTAGIPVKGYQLCADEGEVLLSEAEFLSLTQSSIHELNHEIVGNPKRTYVQESLARWAAKKVNVKTKDLYEHIQKINRGSAA